MTDVKKDISLPPDERFNLMMADDSDYVLANRFFLLGRDEVIEIIKVKAAVIERLSFLGNHLNVVNDPKSDIEPYKVLSADLFAKWMANNEPDPFDGRNDDPNEINRTPGGSMGLISFIDWVRKTTPFDLNFISVQTAVKERLRFYSRQLYLGIQKRLAELEGDNETSEKVSGS